MIGKTVSHYQILSKIGAGGMGVVYKAEDLDLKRQVAIKFLPESFASSEEERSRFKIEAQAAAALNHPNIATIHAIEIKDDQLFIVMEYIDGHELREIIEARSPLQVNHIIDYASQIAEGLSAAHEKAVIHRDIKPANIMITKDGRVKITDFGLAKVSQTPAVTRTGFTVGTIYYMSPEQSQGVPVDHRTDIWSFGVVLYEMLTCVEPFNADFEQAVIYSILNEKFRPISILNSNAPVALTAVVEKALSKDADARYQDMADLIADLKKVAHPSSRESQVFLTDSGNMMKESAEDKTPLSIAVLPFSDRSAEKDQEYFCDGITEELIDALARIEGWRIVSRTSVFAFKGKQEDIRSIGSQLKVTHILEGSVRKAGTRLRITAQLTHTADGFQIWSEKYDCELDDIFAIQDDIAGKIIEKVRGMSLDSLTGIVRHYTEDLEAYNLYLQGRFHLNKRTASGLRQGLSFCNQALSRDANFALAYAGLADGNILLAFLGLHSPDDVLPRAKQAAQQALVLDDKLVEAHTSLGCILAVFDRDWQSSVAEFERAIAINPNSAAAHYWYGIWCLMPRGKFSKCRSEITNAQSLDPLSLVLKTGMGWLQYFERNFDEATQTLQEVLKIDPDFVFARDVMGLVLAQKGMFNEAFTELESAVRLSDNRTLSLSALAHAYAQGGKQNEARAILDQMLEQAKTEYVSAYDIALAYVGLGQSDQALKWLEKALDDHNGWLNLLNIEPRLDDLRKDGRFINLVKKVGLSD